MHGTAKLRTHSLDMDSNPIESGQRLRSVSQQNGFVLRGGGNEQGGVGSSSLDVVGRVRERSGVAGKPAGFGCDADACTISDTQHPKTQRRHDRGGGLLLGGFGMEALAGAAGTELSERCKLADFGLLVAGEFASKAPQQIPKWPPMEVKPGPVESPNSVKDSYVITIQPVAVRQYSFGE